MSNVKSKKGSTVEWVVHQSKSIVNVKLFWGTFQDIARSQINPPTHFSTKELPLKHIVTYQTVLLMSWINLTSDSSAAFKPPFFRLRKSRQQACRVGRYFEQFMETAENFCVQIFIHNCDKWKFVKFMADHKNFILAILFA